MRRSQFTHTFQMRVNEDVMQAVDGWRRQQPDLPSRAEAIRRLIHAGLTCRPFSEWTPSEMEEKGAFVERARESWGVQAARDLMRLFGFPMPPPELVEPLPKGAA